MIMLTVINRRIRSYELGRCQRRQCLILWIFGRRIERNEQDIFDPLLLFFFLVLSLQTSLIFGACTELFVLEIKFHVLLHLIIILGIQRYNILQIKTLTGIPD